MTINDAIYGLRNIIIGDDEQTRIADHDDLNADVQALVDAGEYDEAYRLAIRATFANISRDAAHVAIQVWLTEWNNDFPENELELDEMLTMYAEVMRG